MKIEIEWLDKERLRARLTRTRGWFWQVRESAEVVGQRVGPSISRIDWRYATPNFDGVHLDVEVAIRDALSDARNKIEHWKPVYIPTARVLRLPKRTDVDT